MSKIKQMVRNENMAEFEHYFDGSLWYKVVYMDDNLNPKSFSFPVPINDIGNATFNRVEKALLMMRYIRKHMKTIENQSNDNT